MALISDFPAAHSMDSGWFAVDEDGNLALFDTGEAGAMPHGVNYATGEAGVGDENKVDELWLGYILPWVARNLETGHLPTIGGVYALFDSAENARKALKHQAREVPENELMVEVLEPESGGERAPGFEDLDGFVGFAPTLDEIFCNSENEIMPIVRYSHGDWDIPGHYVREHLPVSQFKAPAELIEEFAKIPVRFTETETLQLADFYTQEECISWSMADLRTGEIKPPQKHEGFWAKLRRFFQ